MLIDSIKIGFNDLKKRKFRTALTSFSIAIGTMLLIVMFGLGEGVQKIYTDEIKQFDNYKVITVLNREPGTTEKNSEGIEERKQGEDKNINSSTLESIKNIEGVKSIVAENEIEATGIKIGDKTGKKISVLGRDLNNAVVNEASINTVKNSSKSKKKNKDTDEFIIAGKMLSKEDKNSVLIGQAYLDKIGITDYNSVIGKDVEINAEMPVIEGQENKTPFTQKSKIIGVINSNYEEGYKIVTSGENLSKLQEYYTGEKDYLNSKGYSTVKVQCNSTDLVEKVNKEINDKLGYGTYASLDMTKEMKSTFTVVKALLIAAGVIVLLVSAIGVINTMTMTVYEKTKSIGIMKAQGASRGHINIIFLVQSGVLGFIGGVVGSILSVIAAIGLDKFVIGELSKKGIDDIQKLFYTPIWAILAAIGFSILVCLIAGILPARRAAKLNPVDSLRYE